MDFNPTPGPARRRRRSPRRSSPTAAPPSACGDVEASRRPLRPRAVARLGDAGLLGLALPEEHGGAGLGLLELSTVLVEAGRVVAPLPLASHGPTADGAGELRHRAQQRQWLPGAAAGTRVLTDRASPRTARTARPHPTTHARLRRRAGCSPA